jgi:pimeloyl-ACP methyl ester carboxylesterase
MGQLFRSAAGQALVHESYRAALDEWPVPHRERTIPTRQGNTFVLECGPVDAPPVILLHGGGATSAAWSRNAGTWAADLRLYAIDVIGEAGFSAPARPAFSSHGYVDWLEDVCSTLGLTAASIVGSSLGGLIALNFAIEHPDRVSKLVLLSPAGISHVRARYLLSAVPWFFFGARGRRKVIDLVLGLPPDEKTPDTERFLQFSELILAHHRIRTQPLPVFSDQQLRSLSMPVLAIVGSHDIVFSAGNTRRRLNANVRGATVIELPDVGHGLRDQTRAVHGFLRK